MIAQKKKKYITASLHTRIYGGFGGWLITADKECIYAPPPHLDWTKYPTLMRFENLARKQPSRDWRAQLDLPLRSAVYQRQGRNCWVLVETGLGFA